MLDFLLVFSVNSICRLHALQISVVFVLSLHREFSHHSRSAWAWLAFQAEIDKKTKIKYKFRNELFVSLGD